ncbi:hypothetical protein BN946_scf184983.g46 [Trametes cinnabarina]|uniref:Uncharacterized protein n=1 Tax=Pycnoporus cinnabarinus TaxID=5643 RepID=A0A060SJD6_PYCCI|nr:hypothetical protein BN946_scf184983.g46 [Trametes cinnabarina]
MYIKGPPPTHSAAQVHWSVLALAFALTVDLAPALLFAFAAALTIMRFCTFVKLAFFTHASLSAVMAAPVTFQTRSSQALLFCNTDADCGTGEVCWDAGDFLLFLGIAGICLPEIPLSVEIAADATKSE